MSWFEERSLSFDGYCSKSDVTSILKHKVWSDWTRRRFFSEFKWMCVSLGQIVSKKISMVCVLVSSMTSMWSLDRITIQVIVYANFIRKLTWIFKSKKKTKPVSHEQASILYVDKNLLSSLFIFELMNTTVERRTKYLKISTNQQQNQTE